MDNSNNPEVFTPDLNETPGGDQNGSASSGDENKDRNELDPHEQKRRSNNSAEVNAEQAYTFQGLFENAKFYFGERSTGPEPGPDEAKHKKISDDDKTRGADESKKREQTTPPNLLNLTSEFAPPRGIRPQFNEAELLNQFKDLENNNLIFITCADEQMAKAAACLLAEKLSLPDPAQKRLLDYHILS